MYIYLLSFIRRCCERRPYGYAIYRYFIPLRSAGHYVFVDERPGAMGHSAILQSPIISTPSSFQEECYITFYYNMRGLSVGTCNDVLTLYLLALAVQVCAFKNKIKIL